MASFSASRSSPSTRRETPPARGLLGISTMKRPARLMKVVRAAPLLPRSSLSTCTTSSWPSCSSSRMPALLRVGAGREVLAGDFLQRQEAVAFGAVFDEAGFQGGLDAGDAALVDVGLLLLPGRDLDVEVVERLAIHHGHAQLFRLSRIDQHTFHCVESSHAARRCAPRRRLQGGRPGIARRDRGVSGRNGCPPRVCPVSMPCRASPRRHNGRWANGRARPLRWEGAGFRSGVAGAILAHVAGGCGQGHAGREPAQRPPSIAFQQVFFNADGTSADTFTESGLRDRSGAGRPAHRQLPCRAAERRAAAA